MVSISTDVEWSMDCHHRFHPLVSSCTFYDASGACSCGVFNVSQGWFCYMAIFMVVQINCSEGAGPHSFCSSLWDNSWSGQHVSFHVDNLAVVSVLQRKSAKNHMLDNLVWYSILQIHIFSYIHSQSEECCSQCNILE